MHDNIYYAGESTVMTEASASRRGPTTTTLRAIQRVLQDAAVPISRYQIRKSLGNSVSQPTVDEALDYLASVELVYDEGPGGKALWIHAPAQVHAKLR